jgi:hypothetical protein
MVKRQCHKCYEIFDRKSTYDYHINRKYDCSVNKKNNINNDSNETQNILNDCEQINNQTNNHNKTEDEMENENLEEQDNALFCGFCLKLYSSKSNLNKHLKICKVKINKDNEKENRHLKQLKLQKDENDRLKKQNKLLMDKINDIISKNNEIIKIHKTIKKLETTIPANTNINISNQYLEQIIQKDKVIEKLNKTNNDKILIDELDNNKSENNELNDMDIEDKPMTLILNNNVIECRQSDGYINATQLCKAGGKLFADWMRLKSTKEYLVSMETNMGIPILDLINKNIGGEHNGTWVHPKVAVNLAQ